ncbi:MAG: chorismate-binding protein [Fidelibacterota bacterium]
MSEILLNRNATVAGTQVIDSLLTAAVRQEGAVAFWHAPQGNKIHVIYASRGRLKKPIVLEETRTGFVLHPFREIGDSPSWFIPGELTFSWSAGDDEIQWSESITALQEDHKGEAVWHSAPEIPENPSGQKAEFLRLVNQGLSAIAADRFAKVIVARTKQRHLGPQFSPGQLFHRLIRKYPGAYVSCVSHPELGTWLGASPELLLEIDDNHMFYTMALAGTQPANISRDPSQASWTQKEIEEQAMVSRFIINQFKKIRVREFEETGPQTVLAGNVMHLCTDYTVNMKEVRFPQLGTVMMRLLHPTSAVCGMPKLPAREFILTHESFDRGLYSGFSGPVNYKGKSRLYVNLRTMSLTNHTATIFAGNGITHDSIPEQEWQETELKCDTILQVLEPDAI